jgi:hypothetical protein
VNMDTSVEIIFGDGCDRSNCMDMAVARP